MKLCQCRSCGKEFDMPLPTMISWLEPDNVSIPVTVEVCPYCFGTDFDIMIPDETLLMFLASGLSEKELKYETWYQLEQAGLIKVTPDGIINLCKKEIRDE